MINIYVILKMSSFFLKITDRLHGKASQALCEKTIKGISASQSTYIS